MAKTKRDKWYDMAVAALAGGAKEASFDLFDPKEGYIADAMEENPKSTNAGAIASYFAPLPLPSKLRAATKLGKLKELSKVPFIGTAGLSKISELMGRAASGKIENKLLKGITSGAVGGGANAAANIGVRKGLGTADPGTPEDAMNTTIIASLLSGGMGGAGAAAKAVAPSIYGTGKIIDSNSPKKIRDKVIKTLMDRGEFGGDKHFTDVANNAKEKYGSIMAPYLKGIENNRYEVGDVSSDYLRKTMDKLDVGSSDLPSFKRLQTAARGSMGDRPTGKAVSDYEKKLEKELFSLTSKQRRGEGSISPEMEAQSAMKDSIKNFKERAIGEKFGESGRKAIGSANDEYRLGKEIEKAQNKPQPDGIRSILDAANSTAARTALGLGLSRVNTERLSSSTGRGVESYRRKRKEKPIDSSFDEESSDPVQSAIERLNNELAE